jgi:rubrerythrin
MSAFLNPFAHLEPDRKMSNSELVMALRQDLAMIETAISTLTAHAETTDHVLAKKALMDIANEERVHAGRFLRLIQIITGDEDNFLATGKNEVDESEKNLLA